jgi:L-lactate dehydrogenase (cytochrome)
MENVKLRQRVLVDVSARDMTAQILGERASLPIVLSTIGLGGLMHGNGEILACRAAHAAGIPYALSTMSICSIEDVAAAVSKPFWFQLYVMKDRGFARSLIERAIAAKCSALVLTVDLQVLGKRHADTKNGLSVPPSLKFGNLLNMASKPRWAYSVLAGKRWTFGNLAGHVKGMEGVRHLVEWAAHQFDPTLNWKDVDWIRSLWPGKLIIKGILDVEDAKLAAKTGATAIVVSNHGGRQLDGAPSTISVLPKISDALGTSIEIMFDGGIRSGQDVMRALALGAKSCLIGRAYMYGLGAGGQAGVAKAIEIIADELSVTMALTGVNTLKEIGRHVVVN